MVLWVYSFIFKQLGTYSYIPKCTINIVCIFQTIKCISVITVAVVFFLTTCVTACRQPNENGVVLDLWIKVVCNCQTVMKTSQLCCSKSRYSTPLHLRLFAGRLLTDFKRSSHNNRNRYCAPIWYNISIIGNDYKVSYLL